MLYLEMDPKKWAMNQRRGKRYLLEASYKWVLKGGKRVKVRSVHPLELYTNRDDKQKLRKDNLRLFLNLLPPGILPDIKSSIQVPMCRLLHLSTRK